ncbi:MAG TPA: uracil-DNA glycosylase family protein [Acidobacteriota bacterium]|nr:uracil-DNA glycosylase family protein [Acidobacteriota bacterium]
MDLIDIARSLRQTLDPLTFSQPVTHVYNPLHYAWDNHCRYLRRYGQGRKEVVFFGMNPGPWGMAQTGVPFGEVNLVKDWVGISGPVGKPRREHPKRPVEGFDCSRSEVSGQRVWGWAKDTFGTAERFFQRFFIANYCPLLFIEESGRNRTPDKLPVKERKPLTEACDDAIRATIEALQPGYVVGIGKFAEKRALSALKDLDVRVGSILHPSPASPLANRGWAEQATRQLGEMGILET